MAKGLIGSSYTFTVLMLDGDGVPFAPDDGVTIEAFYFDSDGTKRTVIAVDTAMTPLDGEVGRYTRTLTLSSDLLPSFQLYGVMKATDPTGNEIVIEQEVDLVEPTVAGRGVRVAFIKPSGFI